MIVDKQYILDNISQGLKDLRQARQNNNLKKALIIEDAIDTLICILKGLETKD